MWIIELQIRLESLALKAYGKKEASASPLDIPKRTVRILFLAAFVLSVLLYHVGMHSLNGRAEAALTNDTLDLGDARKDSLAPFVRKLLPPELQQKVPNNLSQYAGLKDLFADGVITFHNAARFIADAGSMDTSKVTHAIIGKLEYDFLPVPTLITDPPSKVLGKEKYDRPNFRGLPVLNPEDLRYAVAVGLINNYRERLTESYWNSRRMMQAFSGGIQFITVVLAIWGMLLIGLRWLWCSVQLRIVRDGQLLSVPEQEPIWAHVGSVSTSGSTLDHYRKRYGSAFVAVRLLDEAVELKAEAREPEVIGFVNDRIDLMETGVQKGEYLLIDYISYAVPNLGFIGTILGIILSMTSVVGILESSGVLDMVEAFEKVGGALGLAFDTTFVSLVGVLILSFLLARLQKREAEMFEALREKALRHLKYFWLSHGHAH